MLILHNVSKKYGGHNEDIFVLKNINMTITRGEFVAILGPSGSGKSTLLNIIGCLDKPSTGDYEIDGIKTNNLSSTSLSLLRLKHFGFIFQKYNLIPYFNAINNTALPAFYAKIKPQTKTFRALRLLTLLGMKHHLYHTPAQLSGGQQQRVSIARALMNGGSVILADEPTGALDQKNGEEVLKLLKKMNDKGHTIIIVTHSRQVSHYANRIVEITDGQLVNDNAVKNIRKQYSNRKYTKTSKKELKQHKTPFNYYFEVLKTSFKIMNSHKLRTLISMLGIIIGIASVVLVIAINEGGRQKIIKDISSFGTNTIDIFPGSLINKKMIPAKLGAIHIEMLSAQDYVYQLSPSIDISSKIKYQDKMVDTVINGVNEYYKDIIGLKVIDGQFINSESIHRQSQEIVISDKIHQHFFPDGSSPIGEEIIVGNVPCHIIGVVKQAENSTSLTSWMPYTSVATRMAGLPYFTSIKVKVNDDMSMALAEKNIFSLMMNYHMTDNFQLLNIDKFKQLAEKVNITVSNQILRVAIISLIVGSIGIMNIMLVSVSERRKEIGIRMAVGAKKTDILQQFIIESILICFLGGIIGVISAIAIGVGMRNWMSTAVVFDYFSFGISIACSLIIGVLSGLFPAYRAATLNPIESLTIEQ
ncbi:MULTISPECIES: MacB family efflux pump subunit [Brenneria]|uniref:Pyoverdine export ATP-binding/permease protein PvdT n=1 Tax=Brenneria nigrifluens DSM 30175 = ATCC 13028 TaxID=1121120 RepID=A0A2U1UK26_9GAMM|nr:MULTISPECIES: MacB family efflux pump subunit [Brenneria]EHD20355.1 Phosphonate-transporting ATPase [Brenneria sp. EniD312]PWC22036.1 MacB family efflux pump subunit [Brenneria nigrifluens DSM 30175 = ATCC 13028]QCR03563.1 MacB family efflux pump subunit [Brenneria nigrifluens DSM 30175 = ATCC 13028]